ncbi:kinase-like domain-containing protein [Annulohypoxylon truncatum]|uniref:kinase-like domain-containing protein n=1 Tax=Annulohypoxylon truncatum TaxID=327061 RepID=UPI0020081C6F|nr:kinase-like domain-containing protein [Annulohypoxylon truncatum]KAI1205184.1 kinase-like domain-containing protein [Annulohypoxylon truncatum]
MYSKFYPRVKKEKTEDYQLLGERLYTEEKYADAEDAFRRELQERDVENSNTRENTLNYASHSAQWLGSTLTRLAKNSEAEELLLLVVERLKDSAESEDIWIITTLRFLGEATLHNNMYSEAEAYLWDALQGYKRILGNDHIDTLAAELWLGRCCLEQAKYTEAKGYIRDASRRYERVLGKNHQHTLLSVIWLAYVYVQQGKCIEAERRLQDIPSKCEITFGEEHLNTLWCKELLATSHYEQGNYKEAVTSLRTIVQIRKRTLGVENPHTLASERLLQQALSKKPPYTDNEILEISVELKHKSPQWSRFPRTYVLLRDIGCLQHLDDMIKAGFSDYMFPVTEQSLPPFLQQSQRSKLVDAQYLVMSQSLDLERGKHCYFKKDESLLLETKQVLGSGGFGQVDKVLSLVSYKEYARKQVRRNRVFTGNRKRDCMVQFVAEIEILKRINHQHVVKLVGSYTDDRYMGLIMLPVAEMNLATYLERVDDSRHGELRTFFGCLGRALQFLHGQGVRHKDIKPANILVHYGRVFLTDFGLSFDFTDAEGSMTTSMVVGWTRKYGAPEVAFQEPRNTRSDIWSLGVVFLEMVVVLKGKSVEEMEAFFATHGSRRQFAFSNLTAVYEYIRELKHTGRKSDNVTLEWVEQMLQEDLLLRPTATQLMGSITGGGQDDEISGFCGICCSSLDDSGNESGADDE